MTSTAKITANGTLVNPERYANFGPQGGAEDTGWESVWNVNHGYYGCSDTDRRGVTSYQLLPWNGATEWTTDLASWVVEATDAGWFGQAEADRIWALRDEISAAVKASGKNHLRLRITAAGEVTNYDNGQHVGTIGARS